MAATAKLSHPTITATIDAETLAVVKRVARARGMTDAQFAAEAIRRVAESDDDFDAFIQVGIDAIERGDVVSHDEVMAELDTMIEQHRARCG
jgi:predicted transcriptional regulator